MTKSFMSLSNSECLEVSNEVLKNARKLYHNGKLLANNESYGHGISLIILSAEESIKALILLMEGHGFLFRKKVLDLKNLFVNHDLRRLIAMGVFFISDFTDDIKKLIEFIINHPELGKNFNEKKEIYSRILLSYVRKKALTMPEKIIWFSSIEKTRQSGLYVDFIDKVMSPLAMTKEEFDFINKRIYAVNNWIFQIFRMLDDESTEVKVGTENLKKQFEENGWYDLMGNLFIKMKKEKFNPYGHLEDVLKNVFM